MISETRKRGRRLLLLGGVLAALSAVLVARQIGQARQPEEMAIVLYTAAPIDYQHSLREALRMPIDSALDSCPANTDNRSATVGAFQLCEIPARFVPNDALRIQSLSAAELEDASLVQQAIEGAIGLQFTLIKLPPGILVQSSFLGLSTLDSGLREVSIAVDPVTSVGWKVRPGDRVDVLVSYEQTNEKGGRTPYTELLLQDIEVRSVSDDVQRFDQGQSVVDPTTGAPVTYYKADPEAQQYSFNTTVTLAVSLDDAVRLTHMANFAKEVRLLIRRPDDRSIQKVTPVTLMDE
ncbi:MAG: RcpC/CpaB family pilus assembly protein [Caldilineaceae bacterium]